MKVRQFIRPDVAASAIAHLSALALVLLFTDVHPFGTVTAEPIAVDLVAPEEAERKPDPAPAPQLPDPDLALTKPAAPTAAQAASAAPEQPAPRSDRREAALQQKSQAQAAPSEPTPSPAPPPGYTPPEPDLTIKYHVMLGLPEDMPVAEAPQSSGDKPGDGIDATASTESDIESSLIAEFRRHLMTCSKLPAQVARSDNVRVKLRVRMTREGRLAADPILVEATASAKGPFLMRSAIAALSACQPYAMLPVDRYGEWRVIDLTFTPQDFAS